MKDGFDINVAERMPKLQKKSVPKRPWNVEPVQINPKELVEPEIIKNETVEPETAMPDLALVVAKSEVSSTAENTLEEINEQFTQMIFEKKEVKRELEQKSGTIEELMRENHSLKKTISAYETRSGQSETLSKEMLFLQDQLSDADFYIQNITELLNQKTEELRAEISKREALEARLGRLNLEIKDVATLDVKASILERELAASNSRIKELEVHLDSEQKKRLPLEEEVAELKSALDKVHSSLSQIRLKAKREAYGC